MPRIARALVGVSLVVVAAGVPVGAQESTPTTTPASAVVGAGPIARTTARFFLPFGPDGLNPALRVSRETTGSCGESSLANLGRDDAWFCFEETSNAILDPCFASPFADPDAGAVLACVADPFSAEAVLLTTTEPLLPSKDGESAAADAPAAPGPILGRAHAERGQAGRGNAAHRPHRHLGVILERIRGVAPTPAAPESVDPLDMPWALELANGERCTILTGATAVLAGMRINYGCEGGGSVLGDLDRSGPVWTAAYWDGASLDAATVEVASAWT